MAELTLFLAGPIVEPHETTWGWQRFVATDCYDDEVSAAASGSSSAPARCSPSTRARSVMTRRLLPRAHEPSPSGAAAGRRELPAHRRRRGCEQAQAAFSRPLVALPAV